MDGKLLATGKYFLLLSLIAFFYSCSNDSNDNDFRIMNEGLERSNMAIEKSTQTLCHSIQNKLDDPTTSYKAAIWYPKMKMIQEFSKTISDYLEKLKTDVKNEK